MSLPSLLTRREFLRTAGWVALGMLAASSWRWWHPLLAHAQERVALPVIPRRPLGKTGVRRQAFQPLSAKQLAAIERQALPFAPMATAFKRS